MMVVHVSISNLRIALFSFTLFMSGVIFIVTNQQWTLKMARHSEYLARDEGLSESTRVHEAPRGLSHNLWVNICTSSIDLLCDNPLFPMAPSYRRVINTTQFSWPNRLSFAQRMFGFLTPPVSGEYTFAIASDDSSELWLSRDTHWGNSELIAHVGEKLDSQWTEERDFTKFKEQISRDFYLEKGKNYFIDIIHLQLGEGETNHVTIAWKNKDGQNFTVINSDYLLPFFGEESRLDGQYDIRIPTGNSCKNLTNEYNDFLSKKHVNVADWKTFSKVLPQCGSYITTKKVQLNGKHEALLKHFLQTSTYPFDMKRNNMYFYGMNQWVPAELGRQEATEVVDSYMKSIFKTFGSNFKLVSIKNIEKKSFEHGSRYLLELQLNDTTTHKLVHLSNYVYREAQSSGLCYPVESQWNRHATINFVITVKNQGVWVYVFLKNIADIIRETGDQNIRIVIFDYESQDLDLKHAVETSGVADRIKTISKPGKYSRREAFNQAIAQVDDPHSIVMLTDLHLEMTSALLNDIRKHCIEGEQIYTPMIVRLLECSSPTNPSWGFIGYWEELGFGIAAIYKSDWDKSGGFKFDTENKHKWGGEDYELVDSVVEAGLGYERTSCPYIYHYEHKRKGMWE